MKKLFTLVVMLFGVTLVQAQVQNFVYPVDAGVTNVKKPPYNAKGDGITDDTEAIRAAIKNAGYNGVVYFPNGTYIISDSINFPKGNSTPRYKIVQGQSQSGTIIRLKDALPKFQDPAKPIAMMKTSCCVAQAFRNAVRNITFHVGNNNPGAIGLQFFASNQGAVEYVSCISGDGKGAIGLDMGFDGELGPQLARNIYVKGFKWGIYCKWGYLVAMENITVENQTECGFRNHGGRTALRKFTSTNEVKAIDNVGSGITMLSLTDSDIKGTGAASGIAAITSNTNLYVRNTNTSGYAKAIDLNPDVTGCADVSIGTIAEFNTNCQTVEQFPSPTTPLNLPVKETPVIPWSDTSTWANVIKFGADPTGVKDATAAIQAAINSGARTVYFPGRKTYRMDNTVEIKGKVERIIGCEAELQGAGGFKLIDASSPAPQTVIIERIKGHFDGSIFATQASKRTLVLSSVSDFEVNCDDMGDVFLNDWVGGIHPNTPGASIWARQFNTEYFTIENKGAKMWILGWKFEGGNTMVNNTGGGCLEVTGVMNLSNKSASATNPMFINTESNMSLRGIVELNFVTANLYQIWVRETRGGVTKELPRSSVKKGMLNYNGYTQGKCSSTPTSISEPDKVVSSAIVYPNPNNGMFSVQFNTIKGGPQIIEVYNIMGELMVRREETIGANDRMDIDISRYLPGVYFLQIKGEGHIPETIKIICQ